MIVELFSREAYWEFLLQKMRLINRLRIEVWKIQIEVVRILNEQLIVA